MPSRQVSTHDLPTLTGFWRGRDIDTKHELSLFPDPAAEQADRKSRPATLKDLDAALARQHLPVAGKSVPLEQVHRFLARSRSRLAMLQLEDLAGALDQINMPGTIDEHPNWRRKLPLSTSELLAEPKVKRLLKAVAAERGLRQPRARKGAGDPKAPPRPRRRGPAIACSSTRPSASRRRRAAALSQRSRHQPCLSLTDPGGPARQRPWL